MNADVSARLAWPDDAAAIARVQIAAWRDVYRDVLPAEALEALDVDDFAARWLSSLTSPPDARVRALVALEGPHVRGFALVHPSHDPDSDQVADAEVGEFVVDPSHRGAGHGSRLLQACVDTLVADGFSRGVWWLVATDDSMRAFVASSGWEPDGAHRELEAESGSSTVKQVRLHTALT